MKSLQKQIIEVLSFYANSDNHLFTTEGKGLVLPHEDVQSAITQDFGDKALELLKKIQKEQDKESYYDEEA